MTDYLPTFRAIGRAAAPRAKRALRLLWKVTKVTGKVALVLVILFLIVHTALLIVWKRSLNHKLAEMRAQGMLVSISNLAPKPISASQNGATVYDRAYEQLRLLEKRQREPCVLLDFLSDSTKPEKLAEIEPKVRELIRQSDSVFVLIEEAAARPRCVFPVDWKAGFDALYPHIPKLRQLARLLTVRAILDAKDGKMDRVPADVILALRVSSATADEPALISFLMRTSFIRLALNGLQKAVRDHPLSPEQARLLYDELSKITLDAHLDRAMRGELVASDGQFDIIRKAGGPTFAFSDG